MSKKKSIVTEYRSYYLSPGFPVLLLSGDYWKISDIPSGRLHFHNCLEIGICYSHSGTLEIYDNALPFEEGDVTFIPKHVPHTTYSQKGCESHWAYLFFNPAELFKDFLPSSFAGFEDSALYGKGFQPIFKKSLYPKIHFLLTSVIAELEEQKPGYQLAAKGLMLALFLEIWRLQTENENKKNPQYEVSPAENFLILQSVLEYIDKNYMDSFSIDFLANLCHLSPTHFRRIFHSVMGTSPLEFINNTRVLKACSMLRSTEDSILQISENVGFHSVSSFNRCFLNVMNTNPRAYRNKMRTTDRKHEKQTILEFSGWLSPENIHEE